MKNGQGKDEARFVHRDIDEEEDSFNEESYEGTEDYEEEDAVEYIGYNQNKDYTTEHNNFKKYIKRSRGKILRLKILIGALAFLLFAALIFIIYIYRYEKNDNMAFFGSEPVEPENTKLTEDLSGVVSTFKNDDFEAFIDDENGYEYLRLDTKLNGETVSIFFQNEFPAGEGQNLLKNYIAKDGKVLAVNTDYDFSNIENSLPRIVDISGSGEGFLWVTMDGDVPSSMTLFDVVNMEKAGGINVNATIGYYFTVEDGGEEDRLLNITHSGNTFTYQVDDALYNEGRGSGGAAINFLEQMDYELSGDRFEFSTVAKLGDGYIGEYSSYVTFSSNGFTMGEQTYHPYVYPEYFEDGDIKRITPFPEIWEDPILIDGILLKRYENVDVRIIDPEQVVDPEEGFRYCTDADGNKSTVLGIDVSSYQGDIEWDKVATSGVKYAIIRAGYRGYSKGGIQDDEKFEDNLKGAINAGLDVGVYVFTQAINEEEAAEEANYVIDLIKPYNVNGPVVIDTEYVDADDNARANKLTRAQRTAVVKKFCETVKNAGYKPMVYAGTYWLLYNLNWDEFADVPIWYAYYGKTPLIDYKFAIWQYTGDGVVDGITINTCDIDLMFDDVFK